MSKTISDVEFLQHADSFITLANDKAGAIQAETAGAAMTFAAARFAAYLVARSCDSKATFDARKDEAKTIFMEQFEGMLRDNLEEYSRNFDKHNAA